MDSIRQQKISKLLKGVMSDLIKKDISKFCMKALVTVTLVRVTPDLGIARMYLSVFGISNKEVVVQNFNDNLSEIRYLLGKRVRHNLKHIPQLQFNLDDSLDYIEKIDKALKS